MLKQISLNSIEKLAEETYKRGNKTVTIYLSKSTGSPAYS